MSVILNIETSSKNCSVCLSSKGNLVTSFDLEDEAYRHSELLTSSIQNILSENNLDVKDLSAISIGIGPGSFTGLRIGFSVAKGLCYPHNIKLIGISSLKIIANSAVEAPVIIFLVYCSCPGVSATINLRYSVEKYLYATSIVIPCSLSEANPSTKRAKSILFPWVPIFRESD